MAVICFRTAYVKADEQKRPTYLMLIQRIEKEGPFTALRFFSVDRSLLTSQFATVLTYFIILLQFNFCPEVKSDIKQ